MHGYLNGSLSNSKYISMSLHKLYHVLQDKSINFVNFIYQPKSSPNRTTLPAGCCAERELVQQVNDSGEG